MKIADLPQLPTIEQITMGLYKLRYREISVFYSDGDPIAYQYQSHHPVVRRSTDRSKDYHYEKLNIAARLRVPTAEFDQRFLSFVESRWAWERN